MKSILLKNVEIENVRSIFSANVSLDVVSGLNLLTGENLAEPRLEANGAGKTSFFDAIFWCLYGTTVRGAKISSIVSWGRETAKVLLDIRIGDQVYKIQRSGPPNRIEIDGNISEQSDIDRLLGLTKKRFLHSIIFGQGMPLFPDLSGPERGELFDEVLNLGIWQKASEQATLRYRTYEKTLLERKQDEARTLGALSQIETDAVIQARIKDWEKHHAAELDLIAEQASVWEKSHREELEKANADIANEEHRRGNELQLQLLLHEKWKEEITKEGIAKASELEKAEEALAKATKELKEHPAACFNGGLAMQVKEAEDNLREWTGNGRVLARNIEVTEAAIKEWKQPICPTCHQPVSKDKQERELAKHKETLAHLEIQRMQIIDSVKSWQLAVDTLKPELVKQQQWAAAASAQLKLLDERKQNAKKLVDTLTKETEKLAALLEAGHSPYSDQMDALRKAINPYIAAKERLERETNFYAAQFIKLSTEENPHLAVLEQTRRKREVLQNSLEDVQAMICAGQQKLTAVEYWKQGFKRIRLFYVNQQLAALQAEIQNALSALGLPRWQVILATEAETKSGTLKLGININIKSPTAEASWEAWSGGESQRLRLAIAMGLSSLIQRAAGVFYPLEVWDEPTNWLSSMGIEDLLEALRYRAEVNGKSIWIIDHRALQSSSFAEIWVVQKTVDEGSKIYKIYESEN